MYIPQTSLKEARKLLTRLPFTRSKLEVTTHVLATAGPEGVSLAVSDCDHWLETLAIDAPAPPERVLIPADALAAAVKADRGSDVGFTSRGGELTVTIVRHGMPATTTYPVQDVSDYPDRPEIEGTDARLPAEALRALDLVAPCASTDRTREVLHGVFFSRAEGGKVVATDGRKLAVAPAPPLPRELLVPLRAVQVLRHPDFQAAGAHLTLPHVPGKVAITCGRHRFVIRPIDGRYPDHRQVIPRDLPSSATLPDDRLAAVIAWLKSLRGRSGSVRLDWPEPGRLVMDYRDAAGNSATMGTPVEVTGCPPVICFDPANLAAALAIGPTLCLLDEMTPGLTRASGGACCVLMPLRVDYHATAPKAA